MKKTYLLPNYFKKIGMVLAFPSLVILILNMLGIVNINFNFYFYGLSTRGIGILDAFPGWCYSLNDTDFATTILPIITVIGLVFISFSMEKIEDELITKIREKSFIWTFIISSIIFIFGTLFCYGIIYLYFLGGFIYFIFILFIGKFQIELLRLKKLRDEK